MKMQGRAISPGKAEGVAVVYPEPFSFLGGVDGSTGKFNVREGSIDNKVFVFPNGKGSTVGSYVIYDLKVHGVPPLALINKTAETIVTTGAVISDVPMVDGIDVSLIREGDYLVVDGNEGTVEVKGIKDVTLGVAFIVRDGKVLRVRRQEWAHSFPGKWSYPVVYAVDRDSLGSVCKETLKSLTGLDVPAPGAEMPTFMARGNHTIYRVYPMLFEVGSGDVNLGEDLAEYSWEPVSGFFVDDSLFSDEAIRDYFAKLY